MRYSTARVSRINLTGGIIHAEETVIELAACAASHFSEIPFGAVCLPLVYRRIRLIFMPVCLILFANLFAPLAAEKLLVR
jgi:hypothetical protein